MRRLPLSAGLAKGEWLKNQKLSLFKPPFLRREFIGAHNLKRGVQFVNREIQSQK